MNTPVRWVLAVAAILAVGVLWLVGGDTDRDDTVPSVVDPPAAEPRESLAEPGESVAESQESPARSSFIRSLHHSDVVRYRFAAFG